MDKIRKPAAAGKFYNSREEQLKTQIENCFRHEYGPKEIPKPRDGPHKIKGLVSPHAGYPYSGPIAAHGFAELAKDHQPENIIILGPNHTGLGAGISIDTSNGWKTPLGTIEINKDLKEEILSKTEIISEDSAAHTREHSIEVQLPFLQYLFGNEFKIVPISMKIQQLEASEEVGKAITKATENENTLIIASTDLTHYEPKETAEKKDKETIEKMKNMEWENLQKIISEKNYTVCGYGPISSTIIASKDLGAKKGKLFKYATSGDTGGPSEQVVGYCSLGFMEED